MIRIEGASTHNLRDVDVDLPSGKMIVITGVSGSGKSSLAFDTLFAEGQRQFIESMSFHARNVLDLLPRPAVRAIRGLPPTLAVDQRMGPPNPRSTVGTLTEVYDHLRLLMAKLGRPFCYQCHKPIHNLSKAGILAKLLALPPESRLVLLSPVVREKTGAHREVIQAIRKAGLLRIRIDAEVYDIEEVPQLDPNLEHTLEAIVDRIVLRPESHERVENGIRLAEQLSSGWVAVSWLPAAESGRNTDPRAEWLEERFTTRLACPNCGIQFEEIEPRTFSFHSPHGACPACRGTGLANLQEESLSKRKSEANTDALNPDDPKHREQEPTSLCPYCRGTRLRIEARSVLLHGNSIDLLAKMSIEELVEWSNGLVFDGTERIIAAPILDRIRSRLAFLTHVGVGYLSLDRRMDTLSGGERQRVRLATSLGSGIRGACYVLDEPSMGLHPRDNDRLISTIRELQKKGNTVVVVEHDESMMREADWIVDMGPGAGRYGGKVQVAGSLGTVAACRESLTGAYLRGEKESLITSLRRTVKPDEELRIVGATHNNLREVDVSIPLKVMVGITGVSGSGKSSLIVDTLVPALESHFGKKTGAIHGSVYGMERIDRLISIDQQPIGRSPRSSPATYCGVFDEIRKVFALTREAKQRGFTSQRFSFNSGSGRCGGCQGQGLVRIDMGFLQDQYAACHVCNGSRFNDQTLQIKYKGKSIADCLEMEIETAASFFENFDKIYRVLDCMKQVGLGYLQLGQAANTLSGGEAQRIKLAAELAKRSTGHTLYVLDEPTTGLHRDDVRRLIDVLRALVHHDHSVIVIEHHLDVLRSCDWIIDLGPEGGKGGGKILATGTPEMIAACKESFTGRWLATAMNFHERT